MKVSDRIRFISVQMIAYFGFLLLNTQCVAQRSNFLEVQTETQPISIWTQHVPPSTRSPESSTPTIELPRLKTRRVLSTPSLPILTNTSIPKPDLQMFNSAPPGYYLLYSFQNEIHMISLDGSLDSVIGKVGDINFIHYGNVAIYDETCRCTVFYELVDGELKEYGRGSEIEHAGCRTISAPNHKWYSSICQDSSQLFFGDTGKEWLRIVEESPGGTDHAFSLTAFDWSPNSQWLAYFRHSGSAPPPGDSDLVLINITCLNTEQGCEFTRYGPYKNPNQKFNGQGASAWSSDSALFAFASSASSPINIFDTVTKSFTTVKFDQAHHVKQLVWLPDGKALAFSSDFQIFTASGHGGKPVMIVEEVVSIENEVSLLGWISTYLRPRFQKGNTLSISSAGDHLNLRSAPSLASTVLRQLSAGDQIMIIDGPILADTHTWWKVREIKTDQEGWVVENQYWYSPSVQ